IDTHPVEPVGYGHRPGLSHYCASFLRTSEFSASRVDAARPDLVPSGSIPKTVSATSRIAPHTMAESATLKTGHQPTDTKSTTCPCNGPGDRKKRSMRLPSAPPSTRARPNAHHGDLNVLPIRTTPITTATATRVRSQVMPVAMENAAPGLRTRVNVTVSPMMRIGSAGSM